MRVTGSKFEPLQVPAMIACFRRAAVDLQNSDCRIVASLPKVQPNNIFQWLWRLIKLNSAAVAENDHLLYSVQSDFTSLEIAASMSAEEKQASRESTKLHRYSWEYQKSPMRSRSFANHSGAIRGHWSAVT